MFLQRGHRVLCRSLLKPSLQAGRPRCTETLAAFPAPRSSLSRRQVFPTPSQLCGQHQTTQLSWWPSDVCCALGQGSEQAHQQVPPSAGIIAPVMHPASLRPASYVTVNASSALCCYRCGSVGLRGWEVWLKRGREAVFSDSAICFPLHTQMKLSPSLMKATLGFSCHHCRASLAVSGTNWGEPLFNPAWNFLPQLRSKNPLKAETHVTAAPRWARFLTSVKE